MAVAVPIPFGTLPMERFGCNRRQAHPFHYAGDVAQEDAVLERLIAEAVVQYPLPSHWETLLDSESGDAYYWNRVTDQTTWDHPLSSAAAELLEALRDCRAAGTAIASATLGAQARKRRLASWTRRWHEGAYRELGSWRSIGGEFSGTPTYSGSGGEAPSSENSSSLAATTWEDPRAAVELRLRFQSETLASLLSLPVPEVRFDSMPTPSVSSQAQMTPRRRAAGKLFRVEPLPADHSCGFHGLGINREEAAVLLRQHRADSEVHRFVSADFVAAVQTGDRASFPPDIRNDENLWTALKACYSAQQMLDERRREALDLLAEGRSAEDADIDIAEAGGDVMQAIHALYERLRLQQASVTSIGESKKLQLADRLDRCKKQAKALAEATAASTDAEQALRRRCSNRADAYVAWVGSDMTFWLSFVRGFGGNDRCGGILDALAKVRGLTVRVWTDGQSQSSKCASVAGRARVRSASEPFEKETELELMHEASFGGSVVDLWYQGERGHFDRLIPFEDDDKDT